MLGKIIRGLTVFFIGADLTVFWFMGAYFAYKLWLDDPLTAIFKIFMMIIGLGIVTRFVIIVSKKIYWPEGRGVHVSSSNLYHHPGQKLTNAEVARMMQEKYRQKT